MDVEALRTFVTIQREGGISRAAAVAHLSQPAMSRRLAALERELGVSLFDRTTRGMHLTVAGEVLRPFAEIVLAAVRDADEAIRAVREGPVGPVRMAAVGTLATSELAAVLRRFAVAHPGVELHLQTATSSEVTDLVRRADVTVGLRYGDDPDPTLRSEQLFAERMVVIAAPDHPRARRRGTRLQDLAEESWLAFPDVRGRPEAATRYVRRTLDAAGVAEERVTRVDSLTAQKRLVEAGFGIALVPQSAVIEERASGSLVVLRIVDLDVAVPVCAVWRRAGYLGIAAETLLDKLRQLGAGSSLAGGSGSGPGAAEGTSRRAGSV